MDSSSQGAQRREGPAASRPDGQHSAGRIAYRGWWIDYDPPPIPTRAFDWHFHHDDFDGAPDANDNRYGHAQSLEAAKAEIDEREDDQ